MDHTIRTDGTFKSRAQDVAVQTKNTEGMKYKQVEYFNKSNRIRPMIVCVCYVGIQLIGDS
jgi:hypothetical protein